MIFDKDSWHYRLIVYIFGESFFFDYDAERLHARGAGPPAL